MQKSLLLVLVVTIVAFLVLKMYMLNIQHDVGHTESAQVVDVLSQDIVLVNIEGVSYITEIADEPAERALGLSAHTSLEDGYAMLFVFDEMGRYPFWMKDMDFAIDMLWIDDMQRVVYFVEDVRPESFPSTFVSDTDAMYVLEVPAHDVSRLGIEVGDRVMFFEYAEENPG